MLTPPNVSQFVRRLFEDRNGKLWFGTNGGAYLFDGKSLFNLSERDHRLCNNNVNDILETSDGTIWFATTHGGICSYTPLPDFKAQKKSFLNLREQFETDDLEGWSLYLDRDGSLWFPVKRFGIYRYQDGQLSSFKPGAGLESEAIQTIFRDSKNRLWLGGYTGLFLYSDNYFKHLDQTNGPWQKRSP